MDIYLKVTAGILMTVIASLVLSKHGTHFSLLLIMCVSSMTVIASTAYLKPILEFAHRLIEVGKLSNEILGILLKATGIGFISQIAGLICTDSGNQTLGKVLQIMTVAVMLCISVPLLEELLSLMEDMLGEV